MTWLPSWLRWPLACALVAVVASVGGYAMGRKDGSAAAALRAARGEIETRETFDDAVDNPSGCPWADRLLGTCDD